MTRFPADSTFAVYPGGQSRGTRGPNDQRRFAIPDSNVNRLTLALAPEAQGLRLDRALADQLPEHSRTVLALWIREGRITVDGATAAPKTKVQGGEIVVIDVPPPRSSELVPESGPLDIRFEDEYLLLVNKPTGLTIHPGSGQPDGTLANRLVFHFQSLPELIGSDRPGIVHRLDKDTSGILVVAKTEPVQRALSKAFADRQIEKTYVAIAHGALDDEGSIDGSIGRAPKHRTLMAIRDNGRAALTHYRVERRLPRHTVVALHPVTGRTHQLRVHLRSIEHPIVGDRFYGWKSGSGEDLATRLMLHARRIAFEHPVTGARVEGEAPLPDEMIEAVEALAALSPPRR